MSDSSTVLRHLGVTRPGSTPTPPETDETQCGSFGYLRGVRDRALNLELRLESGDSISLPYSWLGPTRFDPSGRIVLLFQGGDLYLVQLGGRNLNRLPEEGISLYELLLRHRVTWVRESPVADSQRQPESECVVDRIERDTVTPEQAASALGFA